MSCWFFQNGRIQCKRRTCKKKRLCKEGPTRQNKCCSCVRKSIVHFSILEILNFVFESKMELLMFRIKREKVTVVFNRLIWDASTMCMIFIYYFLIFLQVSTDTKTKLEISTLTNVSSVILLTCWEQRVSINVAKWRNRPQTFNRLTEQMFSSSFICFYFKRWLFCDLIH